MRKISKIIFSAILMFMFLISVKAVDQKIQFTKSSLFSNANEIIFYNAGSTYKEAKLGNGSKVMAYCFNHQYEAPPVNSYLSLRSLTTNESKKINSFVYILENGWNGTNWKRTGNFSNDEKYYITQLTIWGLQGTDGGGINIDGLNANNSKKQAIKSAVQSFLKDAKAHSTQSPVSINISPKTQNLTLTSDKKYYETQVYNVSGSGYTNYVVNLSNAPKGTIIYLPDSNINKNSGSTIEVGKGFKIKVPVESVTKKVNIGITVSASGTKKDLKIYESSNICYSSTGQATKCQDIGVPVPTPVPVKSNASAVVNPVGSLKVLKVARNVGGDEVSLKDVTISLFNSSGVKVATWNTSKINPRVFNNLPLGIYTLHEESAPAGYTKSRDVKVTINVSDTVVIKLVNTKGRQPIYISKQDATTGTELPGAKLVLKDSLGSVVEEWTSEATPHIVSKQLSPGIYTLSETMAPKGYQTTTETVTFTVNNDGGVDEPVIMKNKPITSIKISKQDATTSKELPGAKLRVLNSEGKLIDEWVSTTKPHYLPENLTPGKYILLETRAPKGYILNEERIEFEVTTDGVEKKIVMKNEKAPVTADIPLGQIIAGIAITISCVIAVLIKINRQDDEKEQK